MVRAALAVSSHHPPVLHDKAFAPVTERDQLGGTIAPLRFYVSHPRIRLKETTMAKAERTLLRVTLTDAKAATGVATAQKKETESLVEHLMGRKPELRFAFIQENAKFVSELDI